MALDVPFTRAEGKAVYIGNDKDLEFHIYADDDQEASENIAGWNLAWVMRWADADDRELISKSTESGSPAGIEVTGTFHADPDVNTQRVVVHLDAIDTYDPAASPAALFRAAVYRYELKRTDSGSETTLAAGDIELVKGTVR